jgi:hypothetical protein
MLRLFAIALSIIAMPARADTPVELIVMQEVSARTAKSGMRFRLETVRPVTLDGVTLPIGATGWGEVVEVEAAGTGGRGGRIGVRLLSLESGGRQWSLEGRSETDVRRASRALTALSASIGPFALLAKGHDARLKAGEIVIGYVKEEPIVSGVDVVMLPEGTAIWLETLTVLSSETLARGDLVPLAVSDDVTIDGIVVIPKGTRAFGQAVRAEPKTGFGVGGRLALELRHVEVGDRIVRLSGDARWAGRNSATRGTSSSAFAGAVAVAITGRRAEVPVGTRIAGTVLRDTAIPRRSVAPLP